MHVLIDIVHPADVLFFVRPIRMFEKRGDRVTVVSRQKDVATDLLDAFGIAHQVISRQGSGGRVALARELLQRDLGLWRLVRRDRPELGVIVITHFQRLLEHLRPDHVHILVEGRIVASGGMELVEQVETDGYEHFR